jgi:hypothetical protein
MTSTVSDITPAINQATAKMLSWTISFEIEGRAHDEPVFISAERLRAFWQEEMKNYSDLYDYEYYPLIATPNIENTIDWRWIALRLPSYVENREEEDGGGYIIHSKMNEMLERDGYRV